MESSLRYVLNTYNLAADDSMRLSVLEARRDGLVTNRAPAIMTECERIG